MSNILDRTEYLEKLDLMCDDRGLIKEAKEIAMRKGEELIDLFIDLENDSMLKKTTDVDNKKVKDVLKHIDDVDTFLKTLLDLSQGYKGQDRKRIDFPIYDDNCKRYYIKANQIVMVFGWAYSSLCEVMRVILLEVINPKKFRRKITGIGTLKSELRKLKYNVSYLDDIDIDIRNSFFHLDFEFYQDKIVYKNRTKSIM